LGQGQLARVELFVNNEKEGKVQKVYLEGNLDPQVMLRCQMPAPPK
jgi:hypothetical protein